MKPGPLSVLGLMLFFVITAAYIVLVCMVQLKLSRRLKQRGQSFREDAERDGRRVTAHLDGYVEDYTDGNHEYIAQYSYTAPNGRRYKMRDYHCHSSCIPSEERILTLHPLNYRKYYLGNMQLGQHPNLFVASTLLCWFVLYYLMMRFLVLPIILPGISS